ncbi:hypothetical protein [Novosphingobium sp.]|uniref:hypothetical protein n=1 Tax=Novosphingobium sp. TaxID=1874826 RepID=UPI0025CC3908|nr:hypothetical protein [Novosphingobium sp.]
MILRTLFGLIALIPAALNAAPAHASTLALPLCDGGVADGVVSIPLGLAPISGGDMAGCCAKGCHGSRKRSGKLQVDPAPG